MNGTVKFFNQNKNFGFIEPDDKSKDVFVHRNDIASGVLNEGDKVEFNTEDTPKGRKATDVKKIDL